MKHVTKTIARAANTRIDQCSCGAIHITVGGVTMRIREQAARELRDVLIAGLRAVDQNTTNAPMPFHIVPPPDDQDLH